MSGICDTCKRKCHARTDGLKACNCHIGGRSRYSKLFGTPERAARTMMDKQLVYAMQEYDALLEWLMGDA